MERKNKSSVVLILIILTIFSSCDFFVYKEEIADKVYIIEKEDGNGHGIYYDLSDDNFIAIIDERIEKYAICENKIFFKTENNVYYVFTNENVDEFDFSKNLSKISEADLNIKSCKNKLDFLRLE